MEEQTTNTTLIVISDLLKRRRPTSGILSLHHHHHHHRRRRRQPPTTSKTLTPNSISTPKTLTSIPNSSAIIGILSLPTTTNSTSDHHSCFSFSDDSGSLCCDVLRFDFRMIRAKIRVTSWNFIPFKQCGGLLEVIDWEFVDSCVNECFRLRFDDYDANLGKIFDEKVKYFVYGVLRSVSSISKANSSGFVAEVLVCDCSLCNSNDILKVVNDGGELGLGSNVHDFGVVKFVYCCGVSLSWYPVFRKVIGSVILLEGLRKKLVYIAKEEVQLMFVSNERTSLRVASANRSEDHSFRNGEGRIQGKGELGMYVGVVRGVYMQGMVVELDEEVWLLLTDESLFLPHSVRVGAIILVSNVHIVSPKFRWGKMLILGGCCKTNIITVSFSPLEIGCQPMLRSSSLLGKFLESLVFPARLWVLLLVQCFKKKFSGAFLERDIVGTKHTEGMVQAYARLILPSSVLQSRHGDFLEFCKHNLCGSRSNICCGSLLLAMPFSNMVKHCEMMFVKSILRKRNGLNILQGCSQVGHSVQGVRSCDQIIRRILPCKDIGVSLLGNLKVGVLYRSDSLEYFFLARLPDLVLATKGFLTESGICGFKPEEGGFCPTTGRLQYIDATGSIDAVIPDIPLTWDVNAIYEVFNYNLVLEGTPESWGRFWGFEDCLFSCSSLFKTTAIKRNAELTVYVQFSWSNVCLRHFATCQGPNSIVGSPILDAGTFHLLFLLHKFPLQRQNHGDMLLSKKSSLFAEVMVLPWDLSFAASEFTTPLTKTSQDNLENGYQNGYAFKRCRTHQICIDKVRSSCNFEETGKRSHGQSSNFLSLPHKTRCVNEFSDSSHVQVPCKVTGKEIHGQCIAVPGILFAPQIDGNCDRLCSKSSRKVLLEFNAENLFKHKLLQIGGIYIMKHCAGKCFCDPHHKNRGSAISITSDSDLWSMSFDFSEAIDCTSGPFNDSSCAFRSTCEDSNRFYLHDELVLSPCSGAVYGTFSDLILHVGADANGLLDVDMGLQALKELVTKLCQSSANICNSGQQVGCGNTVVGFFEKQGIYSGNVLPEGNLISIQGTVVSLHNSDCYSINTIPCNGVEHNVHQPRYYEEKEGSLSMHVLADGQLVEICGRLSKFNCPVGLGPGAFVTFHRLLVYSGKKCLMLTPVSFITVNSVRETPTLSSNSSFPSPEEKVTSCLISDLAQTEMCQPRRFRCSIVGIYFVMLERNKNLDKLFSHFHSGLPVVNIPLAGFIMDDGSSHCCFWTNGESAAKFLRLSEESPQTGSKSSWWRLKAATRSRAFSTPNNQLNRILKRHESVCVKNYGSLYESLSQDLQLYSGSEEHFGDQDENLLKSIMLNACSGTLWNAIGHVMNFDAVSTLEKNLQEEHMTIHALCNVWVKEVDQVNPLAQAKALLRDL